MRRTKLCPPHKREEETMKPPLNVKSPTMMVQWWWPKYLPIRNKESQCCTNNVKVWQNQVPSWWRWITRCNKMKIRHGDNLLWASSGYSKIAEILVQSKSQGAMYKCVQSKSQLEPCTKSHKIFLIYVYKRITSNSQQWQDTKSCGTLWYCKYNISHARAYIMIKYSNVETWKWCHQQRSPVEYCRWRCLRMEFHQEI